MRIYKEAESFIITSFSFKQSTRNQVSLETIIKIEISDNPKFLNILTTQ